MLFGPNVILIFVMQRYLSVCCKLYFYYIHVKNYLAITNKELRFQLTSLFKWDLLQYLDPKPHFVKCLDMTFDVNWFYLNKTELKINGLC